MTMASTATRTREHIGVQDLTSGLLGGVGIDDAALTVSELRELATLLKCVKSYNRIEDEQLRSLAAPRLEERCSSYAELLNLRTTARRWTGESVCSACERIVAALAARR